MTRVGVLEDIRGELEALRDAAYPESRVHARLEALVHDVDELLAVVGKSSGCSLCAAGHVPARPCEPEPVRDLMKELRESLDAAKAKHAAPRPGMGAAGLLNGLQDREGESP